ncbi:endothelial cell-specific chemotaxis regulator-like isoform X3 [Xyrauchen texanus]|uniref:endothelial cell-specific chemotaxis regulator-like isoform X3 n=1 Tax=Xyrauchen texanus TaxID=154827 RepID=UPI0022426876|nr:endothelial cell-specific chemotaxis regulator-like isoform X3 [Xyrauchen texanus]
MSVKQFVAAMEQFFCLLIALIASSSIISAGKDTNILTPSTAPSNIATLSPLPTISSTGGMTVGTATPTQTPDDSLTMLAFGVMGFILILIVVMVILVTTINVRGRCRHTNQQEDTDSPQLSSVRSTIVDNEDQDLNRDLLSIKGGP